MGWQRAISVTFFPVLIFGSLAAAYGLQRAGVSDFVTVFGTTLAGATPILVLQRLMPYQPEWKGLPGDFRVDILHGLLSNAIPGAVYQAFAYGLVALASAEIERVAGRSLWPDAWPVPFQLALAILVGDFFSYWAHRLCHTNPLMWRIHALHHSTERMYVLAAVRNHPLNVALTFLAMTCPALVLGAPPEIMALHAVFNSQLGMLQHSNVDLRTGWLGYVLSTPELHRWHHSVDIDESNHNFGTCTAIWDFVFGTRHLPADRQPTLVGLPDMRIPTNWLSHMAVPFVPSRYSRATAASTAQPATNAP